MDHRSSIDEITEFLSIRRAAELETAVGYTKFSDKKLKDIIYEARLTQHSLVRGSIAEIENTHKIESATSLLEARQLAAASHPNATSAVRESEELDSRINELSGATMGSYIQKAHKDIKDIRAHEGALNAIPKVAKMQDKISQLYKVRKYTKSGDSVHGKTIDSLNDRIDAEKKKVDPSYPESISTFPRRAGIERAIKRLSNDRMTEATDISEAIVSKVGDDVYARHPSDNSTMLTGKVIKIGRTLTTIKHKDGTFGSYAHKDVGQDYEALHPNPYKMSNGPKQHTLPESEDLKD